MSLYSQEKEQEVQVFSLYFEDCFSKKTAMEKSIFHSRVHIKQYLIIYNLYSAVSYTHLTLPTNSRV